MTSLAIQDPLPLAVPPVRLSKDEKESVLEYLNASKAENTKRAYAKSWQTYVDWCAQTRRTAMPSLPDAIMVYLSHLAKAGRKVSTIEQALAAIAFMHTRQPGAINPAKDQRVRAVMAGIRRKLGTRPKKKEAFTIEQLVEIMNELPRDLRGSMAKAIILVGVGSALRRSNLAALNVDDVTITDRGMTIYVARSKTDQEGHGASKFVPRLNHALCPVAALEAWLRESGINNGAIFRKISSTDKVEDRKHLNAASVNKIVKLAAKMAGLDPAVFGAHSMRAALATLAAMAGQHEWKIQKQTGHKSERVLRGYMRDDERAQADVVAAALQPAPPKRGKR